jgi:uncharacterized protein YneF (UPF0154 family)
MFIMLTVGVILAGLALGAFLSIKLLKSLAPRGEFGQIDARG